MNKNAISWFEIHVNDLVRAKTFYEKVFARVLEPLGNPSDGNIEMWAFPGNMTNYGCGGALVKVADISAGNNSTRIYFACDDCAIEEKRALECGGKIIQSKFAIGPYGFVSIVEDTEGNVIGLHSMA